jgi:hypothetical protein
LKPEHPVNPAPADAGARKAVRPVICYPVETLPKPDLAALRAARDGWVKTGETLVPPRDAAAIGTTATRNPHDAGSHGPRK